MELHRPLDTELCHPLAGIRAKLAASEFDYATTEVDSPRRFEYWHDAICTHFVPAESWREGDGSFQGHLHGHSFGNLLVGRYSAAQHSWRRTPQNIKANPDEDLIAYLVESGTVNMEQSGRNIVLRPGEIALYDAASPFFHEISAESLLLIRIPRSAIVSRCPKADGMANIKIGDRQEISKLLGSTMQTAFALPPSAPAIAKARLASALLDTLAAALEMQCGDASTSTSNHDAIHRKALNYIDTHMEDNEVNLAKMAEALHVSERTLFRVFARLGTTPMLQLWRSRLEKSHSLLQEGMVTQVTHAAYQCGFSDVSHFCRMFKKEYGVLPSQVMMRAVS
jgi:AraC-like DNA-binding protein